MELGQKREHSKTIALSTQSEIPPKKTLRTYIVPGILIFVGALFVRPNFTKKEIAKVSNTLNTQGVNP